MALIIKNTRIPTSCYDCFFSDLCVARYCADTIDKPKGLFNKRLENCPISEIPDKHGRLIDEAKLRERAYAIQRRDRISFTDALAMALIEAETIVEATE